MLLEGSEVGIFGLFVGGLLLLLFFFFFVHRGRFRRWLIVVISTKKMWYDIPWAELGNASSNQGLEGRECNSLPGLDKRDFCFSQDF